LHENLARHQPFCIPPQPDQLDYHPTIPPSPEKPLGAASPIAQTNCEHGGLPPGWTAPLCTQDLFVALSRTAPAPTMATSIHSEPEFIKPEHSRLARDRPKDRTGIKVSIAWVESSSKMGGNLTWSYFAYVLGLIWLCTRSLLPMYSVSFGYLLSLFCLTWSYFAILASRTPMLLWEIASLSSLRTAALYAARALNHKSKSKVHRCHQPIWRSKAF
jgi:hypothetical protein